MKSDRYAPVQVMEMALREALAPLGLDAHLEVKKMFGGAGFYVDGVMFAAWFGKEGQLALKLSPELQEALLKFEGAEAAEMKQYIHAPAAFVENPMLLEAWVKKSLDYANSLAAKTK